jgi:hypothetical protein
MASEKKPSIYYDRAAIGSSGELDEYGVWVKSEPQDLSPASAGEAADSPEDGEDAPKLEDTPLNLDDLDIPSESFETDFADFSLEDPPKSSLDEFFPEAADSSAEDSGEHPAETEEGFEAAGEPETRLHGGSAAPAEFSGGEPRPTGSAEFSTQLLLKIADDLASIRNELATLKKELSAIRPGIGFWGEDNEKAGHGFPDKEDDEKITLTGDEFDNILNTADFTGEAVAGGSAAADSGLNGDAGEVEEKILMEAVPGDLDPEDVNLSPIDDAAPEELTDESLDLPSGSDDTSYPEEDLLAVPDGGEEASLDEIETPISIDLDLEEIAASDPAAFSIGIEDGENPDTDISGVFGEAEEEMEFSVPEDDFAEGAPGSPQEEESFAQVIPEGFLVEEEDTPVLDDEFESIGENPAEQEASADISPEFDAEADFPAEALEETAAGMPDEASGAENISGPFKQELKTVLSYMDQLLESLPEDKIEEFAKSEYFDTYKKLFKELGIV